MTTKEPYQVSHAPKPCPAFSCLRPDRRSVLRGTGGANLADAYRTGRAAILAWRKAIPGCAILLHAFTRTRGDAACHLCRMAVARRAWRADRGAFVRAARCAGHHRIGAWLCQLWPDAGGASRLYGHQGCGDRDRSAGAAVVVSTGVVRHE